MQTQPAKPAIDVVVADATPFNCELLANELNRTSQIHVVAWETESAATLAAITRSKPHVALISCDLGDGARKGLSLLSGLRMTRSQTRTVILLDSTDRQSVIDVFRAGARGVLSRSTGLAVLAKCLRQVSEGQVWANSKELGYLLDTFVLPTSGRVLSENCCKLLTHREQEVVQLVADGFSNRDIAAELKLSQHTVKNYLFQVFEKIGVSNRVELVLCALTTSFAGSSRAPQLDKHGVSLALRRRQDTITNA